MERAKITFSGRMCKTQAAMTGKARSLMADSRMWLMISDEDSWNVQCNH